MKRWFCRGEQSLKRSFFFKIRIIKIRRQHINSLEQLLLLLLLHWRRHRLCDYSLNINRNFFHYFLLLAVWRQLDIQSETTSLPIWSIQRSGDLLLPTSGYCNEHPQSCSDFVHSDVVFLNVELYQCHRKTRTAHRFIVCIIHHHHKSSAKPFTRRLLVPSHRMSISSVFLHYLTGPQ